MRARACVALLLFGSAGLAGCGGDGVDVAVPSSTAEGVCNAAAADKTVGYDTTSLVRAKSTTLGALNTWLETRNGPDGPRPVPTKPVGDTSAPVTVCVFSADGLAPPGPPGRPDATGVSMILSGGTAQLDGMGDVDQIAAQLDSLY
jgi:hypothetical protein